MVKRLVLLTVFAAAACQLACSKGNIVARPEGVEAPATPVMVALAGNAYITVKPAGGTEKITEEGLTDWTNNEAVISTYFRIGRPGQLHVALKASIASGKSDVRVTINGKSFTINVSGNSYKSFFVGSVEVTEAGYVKVDLQGKTKTGARFADVAAILVGGPATEKDIIFANDPANYYWSRRGPSCHLNYTITAADKEYFYSELTVPAGQDKTGSYFMANGFGEGYMGIQVNAGTERRILFSVWDPTAGQTTLVRKGEGVTAGRFGGEGTGGQSYMVFNWKAGTTYRFLTKGHPDGNGSTVYTSWFFAPEWNEWRLIASWSRPMTNKYLTNFHGFLENFDPEQGYLGRKAYWSNQWVRLADGLWSPVTEFKFSVDATARNKQRLDYTGGVDNGQFFLQMGGFFAGHVIPGTLFTKPGGVAPVIDFTSLP